MAPRTLPSWQLPAVGVSPCYGAPRKWVVVFLCALEEGQRREILDKLCSVDKTWTKLRPAAEAYYKVKRLIEVPWLRDSEPSPASIPSIIFQIYKAMHYPDSLIFIDRQSIAEGTAIVFNGNDPEDGEAARVPINRAALALSLALQKPLAAVLPDFDSVEIVSEESCSNTPEGRSDKTRPIYRLPRHLPSDFKVEPSTLALISLVHIPDEKIGEIKAVIGSSSAVPHVVIYNWPADQEPCSRAEMYRIFQATKPPYQEDVDETFSMFIDREDMRDGEFRIIVAHEIFSGRGPIWLEWLVHMGNTLHFWHAIWNPFEHGRRGTRLGHARVNTTIFDGPLRSTKSTFEVVSCPDNFRNDVSLCCFVLSQMTETQFRHVRQKLFSEVEDTMQFVDVSQRVKTPDLQGLMAHFGSDEYVHSGQGELPRFFLAVDDRTLEGLANEEYQDLVLVADKFGLSVMIQDDDHYSYGTWSPGYAYSRLDAEGAVDLCRNLSNGITSCSEWCGSQLEFSCWSVFQEWKEVNDDMIRREFGRIDLIASCRNLPDDMSSR